MFLTLFHWIQRNLCRINEYNFLKIILEKENKTKITRHFFRI